MMALKVIFSITLAFAVAVSVSNAAGVYAKDYYAYPRYTYSYGVKDALTGDHKSASETRDGDVTKGSYSVLQPDGVLRTVNYVAGPHTGFQAEVINSGPAVHAVKKVIEPAIVKPVIASAPIADYGHGVGIGYHHGHGHYAPVAKAVAAPIAYGHGYGHGYGGHGAVAAIAKPVAAAVSYNHGYAAAPIGYGHGLGGYGGYAALGLAGGYGGYDGGHLGGHGGFY